MLVSSFDVRSDESRYSVDDTRPSSKGLNGRNFSAVNDTWSRSIHVPPVMEHRHEVNKEIDKGDSFSNVIIKVTT